MGSAVAFPIIGNSYAADESQNTVDYQNFPVRPEVNTREMNEAENFYCYTGAFHQLHGSSVHRVASERILKKVHFHAVAGAFCKRMGESVGDLAFAKQEIFKRDRALRRTDGVQHCRKDVIAVFQRCNFVSVYQGWSKQMAHGADKSVVACVVVRSDGMADFLLGWKKIPDDK